MTNKKKIPPKQKIMCKLVLREILKLYEADLKDFLDRLVTQDKTWVLHFIPESKNESPQWKHLNLPAPKKF